MALLAALCLFLTRPAGFRNAQLRQHVAALLGRDLADYRPAQMTYDLRRLRRKGFICRQAESTRYELTPYGRYTSLFLVRLYQRVLPPGLAACRRTTLESRPASSAPRQNPGTRRRPRTNAPQRSPPKLTAENTDHPSQNVTLFFR